MEIQRSEIQSQRSDPDAMLAITFPEEDRYLFTAAPWRGEYRWFRSANVVPIERWQQRREQMA